MGIYSVIRFEGTGNDWLIYKYPSDEFNTGSKLIVSSAQIALLIHNGKLERICESGTFILDTELLPFVKTLGKAIHSGENPFPLEIYFVNKRLKLDFYWGTSDLIDVIDPEYGIKIGLRMRGQLGVRLADFQYFHQSLIGTLMKNNYLTFGVINDFFKGFINQKARKTLADEIINKKITYFKIQLHLDEMQSILFTEIKEGLAEFGFEVINLSIENIDCPDEDLARLNDILHKKAELYQLGDSAYRIVRGYDVLEAAAESGGAAPALVGVGLGTEISKGVVGGGNVLPMETPSLGKCPRCGCDISITSKFCPECGAKIIHECPKCGSAITLRQKFCPECGEKLYK